MSTDLQWLLLRKNNSFMVKRGTGPVFSSEPGNLMNLHSHKYSGLANAKTIHIAPNKTGGGLKVSSRKPTAHPHQHATGAHHYGIRPGSGPRRSYGIVAGQSRRNYRPDLRKAALARTSKILESQKEKRDAPPKKLRGKKKAAAAASANA
ncbi:hypothetical protein M408DRAFT_327150 [Serendipita vermifera MAFF 305830]|uniref:Ribosomal eL28/Mak16 domain-containing protein n=1 Tax=Serendipita vermifera MAFF 305830 TaxID=933852 RepID=A0A0C2XS00_SERVB|nr:hypothetical protein M408DRAFT_327150 [Serendipita vermifera MAFF 305830]